ncbi:Shedu immune nuclease family protein [Brevundimonas diminuta]|uniref:Shedu protein SduA C-terminal domain-containing protein n=1 Tax=Brevundimonas diminuta TaxID=293 RepID=A0A2X1C7C5_BREDI|nr:Shedu immune nuclease family protein [Brevundimonas diminuta]SPU44365.1 Uncharacterised protein [Brevundimonas diminuta]
MSEVEDWLEELKEDALIVSRVADHATVADFQPCRTTVRAARLGSGESLSNYRRPLLIFDSRAQTITIYPLKTRPSAGFLNAKYYRVGQIVVQVEDMDEPDTEEGVMALLEDLPQGFVREWRWGLGLHKLYKPIIDAVSQVEVADEVFSMSRSLHIRWSDPTSIHGSRYVLNRDDYERVRVGLNAIQSRHQTDALAERGVLAFNALLADKFPETYKPRARPYRPDTVFKVISSVGSSRLSPDDRGALLKEAGRRAGEVAAASPVELTDLRNTLDLAALDVVITRFDALLQRPNSVEKDWQALLARHPFVLGLLFGHPMVLVGEQAAIGGKGYNGKGERYVDFLLKTEMTQTAAIVEIKRPGTSLIQGQGKYASVPAIHGDLLAGVMQILDQRVVFLTHLHAKRGETGEPIEGWHVTCVVIAGVLPTDPLKAKAFELYRHSLRDVVILTYDELLSRLKTLRVFLGGPPPETPAVAAGWAPF